MWKKLRLPFIRQAKNTVGESLPDFTKKLTECYADTDKGNYWQGDIYLKNNFSSNSLPNPNIPYWMLLNRTCQLVQGEGRDIRLPQLNFVAALPLLDFIKAQSQNVKNEIFNLINDKLEGFVFLPAHPENGLETHLVANFNLIHSFSVHNSPKPPDKLIQLSSPFCEHVFQRFSRFFYTVGYDDKHIKDQKFIQSIVDEYQKLL